VLKVPVSVVLLTEVVWLPANEIVEVKVGSSMLLNDMAEMEG
jgi:hypothetical protein